MKHSNFFFRKWTGDFSSLPLSSQQVEQSYYVNRIKTLEESIHFLVTAELKRQYSNQLPDDDVSESSKGKRPRKTKKAGPNPAAKNNQSSLLSKLSKVFLDPEPIASCSRNNRSSCSNSTDSNNGDKRIDDNESVISNLCDLAVEGNTTTFYLTNISLSINGTELDQMSADQTSTHALVDFLKFNAANSFTNNLQSNGIAYKDYMNGYFLAGFDLSTSSECGDPYYTPTVRVGQLRLWVKFDQPLPCDLTMLCFAEYPSLMELSRDGKMKTSYSIK